MISIRTGAAVIAVALLASTVGTAHAAKIVRYQDAATLKEAITQQAFEDFEDDALVDGLSISGSGSITGGGLYRLLQPKRTAVFTFSEAVYGLGGMVRASGFGSIEILLTFEDGTEQLLDPFSVSPEPKSYLGFSSDLGILSMSIRSATAGTVQLYMDDLTFGHGLTSAVPEPASWAMMVAGLGVIGFSMRRRQSRVQVGFA